jgi:hypothetical protein
MKNTLMATVAAFFVAGSATAAELGRSIGVEITENAAGDYVAETTLGVGASTETDVGLAFGGFVFESVDGDDLTVDEWQLGINFGQVSASLGEQDDIFVEGGFEIVGEDTLALPEDGEVESVIVQWGGASSFVGFEDIASDITEVRNVQLAYSNDVGAFDYHTAIDYNDNTEETTVGFASGYDVTADVSVGGVATYAFDAEAFGYEATAGYKFATMFVNGSDDDALENVGSGVNYDFDNLNVYAEASYNIDDEDPTVGMGVALNF